MRTEFRSYDFFKNRGFLAGTIYDGKGRPGQAPRPHLVPLTEHAAEAMKVCNPVGEYALSTNKGKTHVAAETLSEWASLAAGEAGIGSF